jgi:hypothetical protein
MGMSTRVVGFRSSNDPTYQKHAKVLRACNEAGIKKLPEETAKYFGSEYPDECLLEEVLEVRIPCYEYAEDMTEGYELRVSEIPEGVEIIRFVNSW